MAYRLILWDRCAIFVVYESVFVNRVMLCQLRQLYSRSFAQLRPLALNGRLDGHLVQGHVDTTTTIAAVTTLASGGSLYEFTLTPAIAPFIVPKGSVCLDGISLTVVEPAGGRFRVAVIPVTLQVTHLGATEVGDPVNVEADLIGKWIERLLPEAGR